MNPTTPFETIIYALGTIGLILAALFVLRRRPRAKSLNISKPQTKAPGALTEGDSWTQALSKSRALFAKLGVGGPSQGARELREAFEEACIVSDLGVSNTQEVLGATDWDSLAKLSASDRSDRARSELAQKIRPWLAASEGGDAGTWPQKKNANGPTVLWFVGVNGVGKTTSIAKLASELKGRGHSVLLAAGDTFRAAAGEQLETWADRLGVPCVRGSEGADSSSVLFDAVASAKAKGIEFVLCDSAGRLHNQSQLMEALKKNRRVLEKAQEGAPHEVLLVLDANTGQNMLQQAEEFRQAVQVTGLVLTKLDGTARGGAVVAVARTCGLPIRRIGLGEGAADFAPFRSESFLEGLLGTAR